MHVSDTSFLYAILSASDAHHVDAKKRLAEVGRFLLPSEIFSETMILLEHRRGHAEARRAAEMVRRIGEPLFPDADVAEKAWKTFAEADGDLSYPDAMVVAWCKRLGAAPLTFDEEIAKRTGR